MTVNLYTGNRLTKAQGNENFRVLRALAPPIAVENDDTEITNTTRGRWKSLVTSAPSSTGDWDSILTAFDGDLSKMQIAMEHRITGAATLGQPSSGYLYTHETSPFALYMFNSSGHNENVGSNDGRTSAVALDLHVANAGQGDCMAIHVTGSVTGAKSGATGFLANPAVSAYVASLFAAQDGTYLNPIEILLNDSGNDAAAVGAVFNLDRNDATAALGEIWNGVRVQVIGASKVDTAYMATGSLISVFDATHATADRAFTMAGGQKFDFNAAADSRTVKSKPTVSNYYFDYSSGRFNIVINNLPVLTMNTTSLLAYYQLRPATDATTFLGDAAARWVAVHASQYRYGPSSALIFQGGAGSPEGVVTAPIGSLYGRSDGGAGTCLYVKESGTGNTGWVAK